MRGIKVVIKNRWISVFKEFRALLKTREKNKVINGDRTVGMLRSGNISKNKAMDFFLKNNKWPSRLSNNKNERKLAQKFENFISKRSASYDPQFRNIVVSTGRVSNNKRGHDVVGFKKEIIEFLKTYGRVPSPSREYQVIEGEACLRNKLEYYTKEKNDMTLLGIIYDNDKCHRTGIPMKYRKILNEQLKLEKPLIRIVG